MMLLGIPTDGAASTCGKKANDQAVKLYTRLGFSIVLGTQKEVVRTDTETVMEISYM